MKLNSHAITPLKSNDNNKKIELFVNINFIYLKRSQDLEKQERQMTKTFVLKREKLDYYEKY